MFAAMRAPYSVKAYGRYFRCRPRPVSKIANCDLKDAFSSAVSWNIKSAGNRSLLRFTASLKREVETLRQLPDEVAVQHNANSTNLPNH